MQCQFCKREHVDKIFYICIGDTIYQIPICQSCLEEHWKTAAATGQAEPFKKRTGWYPGQPDARHIGDHTFPHLAVDGLRIRRKLSELNSLLTEATKHENYEEAAKLRDHIAIIKEKRCHHGN